MDWIISAKTLGVLGQLCIVASLAIIAFDVRRIHRGIHTTRPTAAPNTELAIKNKIAAKDEELKNLEQAAHGALLPPVSRENLHAELRYILRLFQLQTELTENYFVSDAVAAKASAGRSWKKIGLATLVAFAGIGLQVVPYS